MLKIVANTNITIVIVKIIIVKKFADFISNFLLNQPLIAIMYIIKVRIIIGIVISSKIASKKLSKTNLL
jgi:hypothetical protein